jgi:hypothetical protein
MGQKVKLRLVDGSTPTLRLSDGADPAQTMITFTSQPGAGRQDWIERDGWVETEDGAWVAKTAIIAVALKPESDKPVMGWGAV